VATLAEKGLIAGIYITKHNIKDETAETLKAEIAALQDKRRAAGLPPLSVAADQEGGIVSHLSPPLTKLPVLSILANFRRIFVPRKQRSSGVFTARSWRRLASRSTSRRCWICGLKRNAAGSISTR